MTNDVNKALLFKDYKTDFDYCEKIIQKHSKSFYAAFSRLPKERAQSVYAIYAFCRRADDIVDEEANVEALIRLEDELKLFDEGREINHPIWRALRVVFTNFEMNIAPFYDMITGQKLDLAFEQPRTQNDLEEYCYYVAGSVGLMMLPLLTDESKKAVNHAISLGKAMQITNILRDVGEDLNHNRVYLPQEVLETYGYTSEILESRTINEDFISLWEFEANEAEKCYQEALNMLPLLHKEARQPLLLSLLFYREILEAVRTSGYQCFTKRNYVSHAKKLLLFKKTEKMVDDYSFFDSL